MKKVYHLLIQIPIKFWEDAKYASRTLWQHLRAYWWLRPLVSIGIVLVVVAIWAQATRDTDSPNRFARWLYTFINDWSALLYTLATLMLAMAAFLTIMDNRNERRLKVRIDTLRDIVEWARDSIGEIKQPSLSMVRTSLPEIIAGSYVATANARGIQEPQLVWFVDDAVSSLNTLNARVFSGQQTSLDQLTVLTSDAIEKLTEVIKHASSLIVTL